MDDENRRFLASATADYSADKIRVRTRATKEVHWLLFVF